MSIVRTALPLVLLTSVLTGCAGLQKTDWPTCAAVGGVVGAGLGATESSAWAGYGALKTELADVVVAHIEPIRNRAEELLSDPAELDRLLAKGAAKANELAEKTLATVYERIGFIAAK